MTTKQDLIIEVEAIQTALEGRELSPGVPEELAAQIEDLRKKVEGPKTKLTFRDLKGVGKEIWQNIDVDEYIREERRS